MTTDHDDQPISPPPLPAWAQVNAPPGAPMPLSPGAVERHVLPAVDLLERAADLLDYVLDCEVNRRPIGRAADFVHWTDAYRRLCADE